LFCQAWRGAQHAAGTGGQKKDDQIVIPFTTAMRRITGDKYLRIVTLEVRDAAHMDIAQDQITRLLRRRHRLLPGDVSAPSS
jgi:hypothetical protein